MAARCYPIAAALIGATLLYSAGARCAPATLTADLASPQAQAQAAAAAQLPPVAPPPGHRVVEDPSGRKQVGGASVYAGHFEGHRMADGNRFRHRGAVAASRSLPLGTVAKVTNLQTGRTATVTVEDHGPYVDGRAVDLTRATAAQIGLTRKDGVAPVEVAPVAVPQKDGTVKAGAGALPGPA